MTAQLPQPGPIADVQVGMPVLDSNGDRLGKVEDIKLGDPGAVTSEGQRMQSGDPIGTIRDSITGSEPNVQPQLAERLLRTGYIKIDAKGLFTRDLYASAEQIQNVDSGEVRLSVPREQLTGRN